MNELYRGVIKDNRPKWTPATLALSESSWTTDAVTPPRPQEVPQRSGTYRPPASAAGVGHRQHRTRFIAPQARALHASPRYPVKGQPVGAQR
jgi:hypothetical protein